MRWVLVVLLAAVIVAAGCSGDDDDTATTTTTGVPSSTTVVSESDQAVATTTTIPTHQIGETVEVYEGATLTITSVEADVPDCGVVDQEGKRRVGLLKGDEERFVLIRGTYDYNGTGPQPLLSIGATLSERDDADGRSYPNWDTQAGTEFPVEVEWCFFIPVDKPSWTFAAPLLFLLPTPDWSPPEWDVSV